MIRENNKQFIYDDNVKKNKKNRSEFKLNDNKMENEKERNSINKDHHSFSLLLVRKLLYIDLIR